MTHTDILTMELYGTLTPDLVYEDENIYCECGAIAENEFYKICGDCINTAMLDDKTRIAYINSDKEFPYDWMNYTDDLRLDKYEPTKEELEVVKNECEEDKWILCASIKWINEDRDHFVEWLHRRKV